jgi:hypothetical protein
MKSRDNSKRSRLQTSSFRISGFTVRDFLRFIFAFLLVTLFSLAFGWLPAQLLPEKWLLIWCGFLLGFFSGILVCLRFQQRAAKNYCELSPEVQAVAGDPNQLIIATEFFMHEHPNFSFPAARERIESFVRNGI